MTQEEATTLAKSLWGEKGWADFVQGLVWAYGVGVGDRTLGTGDSFDEAFARAKLTLQHERECPSIARLLL